MAASPPPIQMPARIAATIREVRSSIFPSVSKLLWRPRQRAHLPHVREARCAGLRREPIAIGALTISPPNGLELRSPVFFTGSCPASARRLSPIVALARGPSAPPYGPARRVSFPGLRPGRAASCWAALVLHSDAQGAGPQLAFVSRTVPGDRLELVLPVRQGAGVELE